MMRLVFCGVAVVLLLPACDSGDKSAPLSKLAQPPAPPPTVARTNVSHVTTRIVGATSRQKAVLRGILGGLGKTPIAEIQLVPARGMWEPYHPHSVVVRLKTVRSKKLGLARWEADLVAYAFEARSRELHLRRVAAYETASDGIRLDGPDELPPDTRTPIGSKELESSIIHAVNSSGGELVDLRMLEPRYPAATVTFRVRRPAVYVKHHLQKLLLELPSSSYRRYDGLHLLVTDWKGKPVWLRGGGAYTRPDLVGCDPEPGLGRGARPGYEPPPCPVG
jgi:hypothetical protein